MDIQQYTFGHVPTQIPNQYVQGDSCLSQQTIGLQHHSVQDQDDSQGDSYTKLQATNFNEISRKVKNFSVKGNSGEDHLQSFHAIDLKSQLSIDAALKEEFLYPDVQLCQLQNQIQSGQRDSNSQLQHQSSKFWSSSVVPIFTVPAISPNFSESNSLYPDLDLMASDTGCNTLGPKNINYPNLFEGSKCNGHNREYALCDVKSATSFCSINQVAREVITSPEQHSSITACSDGDGYSDSEHFDSGSKYNGSRTEYVPALSWGKYYQQDNHQGQLDMPTYANFVASSPNGLFDNELPCKSMLMPRHDPYKISEDSDFVTSRPAHEEAVLSQIHIQSQQCYQQLYQPGLMLDVPFDTQSNLCPTEQHSHQRIRKRESILQASAELLHKGQLVASDSSAVCFDIINSSSLSSQEILLSYIKYKNISANTRGSHISYLGLLHSKFCINHKCNCKEYDVLVSHFDDCQYPFCSICGPVRQICVTGEVQSSSEIPKHDSCRDLFGTYFDNTCSYDIRDFGHPPKRLKKDNSVFLETGISHQLAPSINQQNAPEQLPHLVQWPEASLISGADGVKEISKLLSPAEKLMRNAERLDFFNVPAQFEEFTAGCRQGDLVNTIKRESRDGTDNSQGLNSDNVSPPCGSPTIAYEEEKFEDTSSKNEQGKSEANGTSFSHSAGNEPGIILREKKIEGASLADFFTEKQMREHVLSFHQKRTLKKVARDIAPIGTENSCQLCGEDRLVFAPKPIYCSCCNLRIGRSLSYYWMVGEMKTRYCFCTKCFKDLHRGNILFQGISFTKAKLQKARNNEHTEESWVQCDTCKCWQHQICALYNPKKDVEGRAQYICPTCSLGELENGKRIPLPEAVGFAAKDLPSSILSDYIEQRLIRRLKDERAERAKALGKKFEEVPAAADLVVRVVLSANKQVRVKQQFLDIFHGENYPEEFPYRSKVILLFQKIERVDVCLFGMYIQEFGSDCDSPNQRSVYVSYLDSVKYFRPETKTVTGEALRTFVYHEILIGYLEYCKKRGFATCYIWACPPIKGEDYILYCHPETQKTPKSDKLRQWYKSMLSKAVSENVVVNHTNIYSHFFVPNGEGNNKITAARLPYFDGSYWSGAAEELIRNIEQENGRELQGRAKKPVTKRTLKAMGHDNCCVNTTDVLVMQKLGQTILPVKEDFIIAHLQYTCMHCHEVILSGSRWYCDQCKNFQLCVRCIDMVQNTNDVKAHTTISGEQHPLFQVQVNVPFDTEDKDILLDNEIFENRHTFLSFCQDEQYQFDTLRRAMHSSMMILYHLHKMIKTVRITFTICRKDVSVPQVWHCERFPESDGCHSCYQRKGGACHIHELTKDSSIVSNGEKEKNTRQHNGLVAGEVMDALMHAIECHPTKSNPCSFPKCAQIKKLFRHTRNCQLRYARGCKICQQTWFLLQVHSRNCRDSDCRVPRCMDLKKHREKLASNSEPR